MNIITDKEISEGAIASRKKQFISIEDYQTFESGVRFAESIFETKIKEIVKYTISVSNSGKSMDEITKDIIKNDVL